MDNKEGIVHEGQREDQPDVRAAAASNATDALHALRVSSAKPQQDVSTAAAAEKIDVQSLHNRVSALEDSWRAWTNSQPGQTPSIPPPGCASSSSTHPPPPPPPTALIAAASPSDDLASALVDDDEDEPEGVLRAKQIPMSSRMGVTLSHIALLPPRHIRSHLWNAAQLVIGPHAGLSRRTRIRFERMCTDIQGEKSKKWPLSLLAAGTAGLAIGAQVVSESAMSLPHSPTPSTSTSSASPLPTLPPCHRALYTLSNRSLSPNAHDTDAVLAALLHAAHGTLDGRARVKPSVWPDVCRAVGVARGMGLGMGIQKGVVQDDVEEWRVRVWWRSTVLIYDNTFSATLPSQTEPSDPAAEGEKPDGLAYFFHKCRLAQMIKSLKRRMLDERPLQLDSAGSMERTITDFMKELPPEYRLDMSLSAPSPGHVSEDETILQIQRCELSSWAHSLILKTYYPFLKRGESSTNFATPHNAALACSNAAHSLIVASTTAHRFLPRTRSYSFAQQLFGGAVVAASVAITSPTGMLSQIALKDVKDALSVLRELDMYGHGLGTEGIASEAVRVVEILVSKAEGAMGVGGAAAGAKRKREGEGLGLGLGLGFELPFVGASVVTADDQPIVQQDHSHIHTHSHPEPSLPLPIPIPLALPQPTSNAAAPTVATAPTAATAPAPPSLTIPPTRSPSNNNNHNRQHPNPTYRNARTTPNRPSKTTTVVKSRAGSERSGASPVTSVSAGSVGSGMSPPGGMQGGNGMGSGGNGMQSGNGMQNGAGNMQSGATGMQPPSGNGMPPPNTLQAGSLPLQSPSSLQPPSQPHPLQPHLLPDQPQPYNEYQTYTEPYYNNYYAGYDYNIAPRGTRHRRSRVRSGIDSSSSSSNKASGMRGLMYRGSPSLGIDEGDRWAWVGPLWEGETLTSREVYFLFNGIFFLPLEGVSFFSSRVILHLLKRERNILPRGDTPLPHSPLHRTPVLMAFMHTFFCFV
ncbi:Fungal specific transcription factor domain [Rhizoctonia solani]|uniref:Fungal specific transcription factor domain n=1 Tax=Rhizoctonia solani TaxID=456999 RepID=A0A8H7IAF6_9AGAM|nr:Fungal specific transcription factor domain [Rhizoctonia solani]